MLRTGRSKESDRLDGPKCERAGPSADPRELFLCPASWSSTIRIPGVSGSANRVVEPALREGFVHDLEELRHVDGLGEIGVGPGRQEVPDLAGVASALITMTGMSRVLGSA